MFSNFKPINDYILVEIVEKETTSKSGIILTVSKEEKNQIAKVIHCGKSHQVKENDLIYYKKYIGNSLDDKLLVLKEEDILGIL